MAFLFILMGDNVIGHLDVTAFATNLRTFLVLLHINHIWVFVAGPI